MPKTDPRVDAYIAKAADFAKPILRHLRQLVHAACPDVEETLKWDMPHFLHRGILLGMGAFQEHCAVVLWKSKLILAPTARRDGAMGQFGRITSLSDLPPNDILLGYIRRAVELNEAGVPKAVRGKTKGKTELVVPDDFLAALTKHKRARMAFENFSPSHKREYVEWIASAKRMETRSRRVRAAIARLTGAKSPQRP